MRKNIFDILSKNLNLENETARITTLAECETTLRGLDGEEFTLFEYVDDYCFRDWPYRSHCLDVDDFLNTLGYEKIKRAASHDLDSMLTLIEVVYNFWILAKRKIRGEYLYLNGGDNFFHLKRVMDDILAQKNHIACPSKEGDRVFVIEDKPEVTAAAEIVPEELSLDVIRYNHASLKGNIELKRAILIKFGSELEPRRKDLQRINKQLENNIFFMLNNLHIRHNNMNEGDRTKYKEYVAQMQAPQLEKWYDELYQMILLAILLLDNVGRENDIEQLKQEITGGCR